MSSLFKPKQVGPTQGDITEASKPYGLTGPTGGITWDYDAKMGTATLSPEMAALADRLFGRAETQATATTAYDPQAAATQYYQQYVEPELQRQQAADYMALENRLLSQGMLGSTGGAAQVGELARAQEQSRRMGMAESFQQSQSLLDSMRQREMADIAQAAAIYEAPISLFQTGAGVGQGIGGILGAYRPQYQNTPFMNFANTAASAVGSYYGAKSDIRLKENVEYLGNKNGVNFYSWDWNDKAKKLGVDNQPTTGVIAQDLISYIPEAVHLDDDGYYSVDYSKVV